MKAIVVTLSLFFLASCSMTRLESDITNSKHDGLSDETLLRYSSERINKLYNNKDLKLSALAKCHNGNINQGLRELKKIFKDYKKDHDYWNKVGTCYFIGNNTIKAEFFFNQSLLVSTNAKIKNPNALNNLGVIFLKNRHYNQAFEMFTKSKKESPRLLTPDFNLAQLNIEFGHINRAEKSLRNLLAFAPRDVDILASMATVKMMKKQYKSSEAYFLRINEKHLKRADISNHYAMVLYKLGKFKKAQQALKSQEVSIIKPVVKMRKQLALMIKAALEKEKRERLNNKNKRRG